MYLKKVDDVKESASGAVRNAGTAYAMLSDRSDGHGMASDRTVIAALGQAGTVPVRRFAQCDPLAGRPGRFHGAATILTGGERQELRLLAAHSQHRISLTLRARITLGRAEGRHNRDIVEHSKIRPGTVGKWCRRYLEWCPEAPRTIDDTRIEALSVRILESVPTDVTYWSSRCMARACGLSYPRSSGSGAPLTCSRIE